MDALVVSNTQIQFQQNLFKRFIAYTDVKDITLRGYTVCIRQFINWMNKNSITQPDRESVKLYKRYLDDQNFTAGTKAQYLRAVKHFFKWTASEGLYPNIADGIKGAKVKADNTKKEAFSEKDIKIILDSIDRTTEAGKRNYCMILLSVTGGLRIIELQRADIQDMQTIRGERVLYIQGKGRDEKDEFVKLPKEVAAALDIYLMSRGACKKEDPLFSSTGNRANGCRLTEPSISRIIKNVFKTAGYDCDKLTAHSLRHTSNTLLFKAGADLYTVQRHARHADPKTTEIYLHAADRENDRSEQQIYDRIFEPEKKDVAKEAYSLIQGLSEAEQQKVLSYIKELKKAI